MMSTRRPRRVRLKEARARHGHALAEARGEAERASLAGRRSSTDTWPSISSVSCLEIAKPKAGAAIFSRRRGIGLLEGLEQPRDLLVGHADPGIAHRELDELAVVAILQHADLDGDLAAAR